MYFTDSDNLHRFEKDMISIPFFGVRKAWDYIDDCTEWRKYHSPIRDCMDEHCPYLKSKIRSDIVTTKDLFEAILLSIPYGAFKKRVRYVLSHMTDNKFFVDRKHKSVFLNKIADSDIDDNNYIAGIYILTMYPLFFDFKVFDNLDEDKITKIDNKKLKVLARFATEIFSGDKFLDLKDISDRKLVVDDEFICLCNAILIRRFGVSVLKIGG